MATASTASTNLLHLPLETLQQIASHLDDTHRSSFYALGLASKACRRATLHLVFRTIRLSVQHRDALQSDANTLVALLSNADSARHVRRLCIKGSLIGPDTSGRVKCHRFYARKLEVLGHHEPTIFGTFFQHDPAPITHDQDMAWAPVVDLVKTLPHLAELVYDCRGQFPPCLLSVLHTNHPRCKLSLLQFRLGSLSWDVPDAHEMAVATSPCLHSVAVDYLDWDTDGNDDYNLDAMLEMVAGLAPNLKEVRMVRLVPGRSRAGLANRAERQPWRGLPQFVPGRGIGALTSLSLAGAVPYDADLFQAWNTHTDMSSLRHLALEASVDSIQGGVNDEALTWIMGNCSLIRLKTLRIRLDRDDNQIPRPNYTDVAVRFFKALEPLDELAVSGSLEPAILDAILSQHGRSLQKLTLRPLESYFANDGRHIPMFCTKDDVLRIQAQCPALEELAIPIKRTKSDAREADMYRTLGELASVQNLFIILDCSDWYVARGTRTLADDPSFDDEDRRFYPVDQLDGNALPVRRGHLRDAFLNCAVDETLALSIWETICRHKKGRPLQSLKIFTTGGGSFGWSGSPAGFWDIVHHLSRSWLIERSVRNDRDCKAINIRELGQRAREMRDEGKFQDVVYIYGGPPAANPHAAAAGAILRRIWPCADSGADWRNVWTSLPLQI